MGNWTRKQRQLDTDWVLLNANDICEKYLNGYSILELQKIRGGALISRKDFEKILSSKNISLRKTRTARMASKTKETCLEKFGYENPSSSTIVKIKRTKTFLDKYGVENPFQAVEVKQKIAETNFARYGHQNYGCIVQRGKTSKIHMILSGALTLAQIIHENEVLIKAKEAKTKTYVVDIMINNICVVEVYGDYYHANPNKYKMYDKIKKYKGFCTAEEIWSTDAERIDMIREYFPVLIIWEIDIKTKLVETVAKIKEFYENCKHST